MIQLGQQRRRLNIAKITASPSDLLGKYATSPRNKNHCYIENTQATSGDNCCTILKNSLHPPERDGQAELA